MDYDINKIKMIISDIDGVWTDGSIYVGSNDSWHSAIIERNT